MRESSLVPTNLLTTRRVADLLPEQKLLLISLWSAPWISCAGAGEIQSTWASAISLTNGAFLTGLKTLENQGLIQIDEDSDELLVVDWFRFHKFSRPIQKRNLETAIKKIRSERIKKLIDNKINELKNNININININNYTTTSPPVAVTKKRRRRFCSEAMEILSSPAAKIPAENQKDAEAALAGLSDEQQVTIAKLLVQQIANIGNVPAWLITMAKRARDGDLLDSIAEPARPRAEHASHVAAVLPSPAKPQNHEAAKQGMANVRAALQRKEEAT